MLVPGRLHLLVVVGETLTSTLKKQLRAVIDQRPTTEAELRKLSEEGKACALILIGLVEREEQRLAELGADPASSFADVAAAFREVNELRSEHDELHELLAALESRAREFRTSWLSR